jgi:hypothetical protein
MNQARNSLAQPTSIPPWHPRPVPPRKPGLRWHGGVGGCPGCRPRGLGGVARDFSMRRREIAGVM